MPSQNPSTHQFASEWKITPWSLWLLTPILLTSTPVPFASASICLAVVCRIPEVLVAGRILAVAEVGVVIILVAEVRWDPAVAEVRWAPVVVGMIRMIHLELVVAASSPQEEQVHRWLPR